MKNAKELALLAARALSDKKGKEIQVLEIGELTTLADYFVIATGSSNTQINALVDNVEKVLLEEAEEDGCLALSGLIALIWQQLYNGHFFCAAAKGRAKEMQEVADYIQAHYQEEISLKMLAQTAHMSEGQLCRRFRREMGETPFTWLKRCRIKKSCAWLAASDKKVAEICTLCGFNNISYFNREFLREMKLTPSEYRKLCKNSFDKTRE